MTALQKSYARYQRYNQILYYAAQGQKPPVVPRKSTITAKEAKERFFAEHRK